MNPENMAAEEKQKVVDWDHFNVIFQPLLHRIPTLASAFLEDLIMTPEPFSPDGNWILGRTSQVKDLVTLLYIH